MPPHDETSPVGRPAGSNRRPPAAKRPAASGRARSTSGRGETPRAPSPARAGAGSRSAGSAKSAGSARSAGGSRPAGPGGGSRSGGGGRPPGSRPPARGASGSGGKKKGSKKQRRRRILAWLAATLVGAMVLLGVFVGVVYASTEVPSADAVTGNQTTVIYYADGTTEMARLAAEEGNRTNVTLDQVSEPAREAVLAAENRSFYSDPGISVTGIARAAWNNLTGGSTQGGSTITQQYVKNAFLNADQTFSRKFKELFLAVKLDNQYTKDEILEKYLNTIYFGRGVYGIEAAANTYFGVPAAELTAEQGAVLAVLVRSPSAYDPETNPEGAQDRWSLVLDAMVEQNWLDATARAAMVYPPVLPKTDSRLGIPSGPEGLIVQKVLSEVRRTYPDVEAQGLRITTTVNKGYQDAAVAAVQDVMQGEPGNLRQALVSIDPRTGGVLAYYGNATGSGEGVIDYAQAQRQPGSSMKPYVLATALEQGISVNARRNGSSPQKFPDRTQPVRNASNAQCAACTLTEAITKSLNTTFYGLAYEVGAEKVRTTALTATGLPEEWGSGQLEGHRALADYETGEVGGDIGIGRYEMRPIDQAVGFATLASGGVRHDAHFVARVADSAGKELMTNDGSATAKQVIRADVANDVTFALEGVAVASKRPLEGNRPVASKTGTQGLNDTDNSDAWMVGYTPSISTAVWMGSDSLQPIVNAQGRIIYGSGLPGAIWQQFMDAALAGTPEEPLPSKAIIKGDTGKSVAVETTPSTTPESSSRAPRTPSAPATSTQATESTEPTETTENTTESTPTATSSQGQGIPIVPPGQNNRGNGNGNGNGGGTG
ncbi:MAG TPA: transglycosylase domain-containing protein [Modestobacter sp.]|nr:transglycosylase domain-containing protein [Modestobacter sp.]